PPGARPGPAAEGTRQRGARAAPAWRPSCPRRSPRCRTGRSPLPTGPGPGRGAGHAPAPGPLPPGPRHAVCHHRPARAGPRRPDHRHCPVPHHGDDLLAAPGRSRAGTGGGTVMDFDELLAKILQLLQQEKRLSYRALKRRFALDDEYLEDLKVELIQAKQVARDETGAVLVWTGSGETPPSPPPPPACGEAQPA